MQVDDVVTHVRHLRQVERVVRGDEAAVERPDLLVVSDREIEFGSGTTRTEGNPRFDVEAAFVREGPTRLDDRVGRRGDDEVHEVVVALRVQKREVAPLAFRWCSFIRPCWFAEREKEDCKYETNDDPDSSKSATFRSHGCNPLVVHREKIDASI